MQYLGYKVDALALLKPYADFNLDGTVDAADFGIWRAAAGLVNNASFESGDANGDGVVDAADYVVWRQTVGPATNLGVFTEGGSLEYSSVPEPTTYFLAYSAVVALLAGIRRRAVPSATSGICTVLVKHQSVVG